jgi:O-antigen/teichoic acid export membrane protein
MGPEFEISYRILAILTVSSFFSVPFEIAGPVYPGMNKVKLQAVLTLSQGLVNLCLTIFLVSFLQWGIEGVAWGTFYPRIFWTMASGLIVMRWIKLNPLHFFRTNSTRWLLLGLIFGALTLFLKMIIRVENWTWFFSKILLAILAYIPLAYFILLNKEEKKKISFAIRQRLRLKVSKI